MSDRPAGSPSRPSRASARNGRTQANGTTRGRVRSVAQAHSASTQLTAPEWRDAWARLIEARLWVRERDTVLTALGLDADPGRHLRDLAADLDDAYRQVGAGLAANSAVSIKNGKLAMSHRAVVAYPDRGRVMSKVPVEEHAWLITEVIGMVRLNLKLRLRPWP